MSHPTAPQRHFFDQNIANQDGTILTLKRTEKMPRGFAVNIRGPFKLELYSFGLTGEKQVQETVIDVTWDGPPESDSHLHCTWEEWLWARLSPTNQAVRNNINFDYQLAFFLEHAKAERGDNNESLFWFYLKDGNHRAVLQLPQRTPIEIGRWP